MNSAFDDILPTLANPLHTGEKPEWCPVWQGVSVPGRYRIDPHEVPLGAIEPGLGVTVIWFWCARNVCPQPWPRLGDQLVIRGQVHEIVERDEDDLGELGFRLIRKEKGIRSVTVGGPDYVPPMFEEEEEEEDVETSHRGRPSRYDEIAEAFSGIDLRKPTAMVIAAARRRLETNPAWRERTQLAKRPDQTGISERTLRKVLHELRSGRA